MTPFPILNDLLEMLVTVRVDVIFYFGNVICIEIGNRGIISRIEKNAFDNTRNF